MNEALTKDKAIFVVALLGAFLAFSPFKDDLSNIYILIGNIKYTLLGIMITFIALLALSVYLYALDYIRYNFGKYQNAFVFRCIIPVANFFYSVAILFPLLILFLWIVSFGSSISFVKKYFFIIWIFDFIGSVAVGILSIKNSVFLRKEAKKEELESIEKAKAIALQRAIQLLCGDFYRESMMESFKALELALREILLQNDSLHEPQFINVIQLANMALENKLINKNTLSEIQKLQSLRDKIIHSWVEVTKDQANFALKVVRDILEKDVNNFKQSNI